MPLPEDLRQEYLAALGIARYYPRIQLPGAPASTLVDIQVPQPEATPAEPPAIKPQARQKQPVTAPAAIPATTTTTSVPPPDATATAHREEVRIQLLCIRASDSLAVITAMPHLGPQQLSPRHQTLLANLLAGCGIPATTMTVDDKPFRWPMVTGLHVDNSRRAAAAALKAYLHQKRVDWQFNSLLVMGETVINQLFESGDRDDSDVPAANALVQDDCEIVYTRSLDELLQRPLLKKETWGQIRQRIT